MHAEDEIHPIHVMLERIIAKEVLTFMGTLGMATDHNFTNLIVIGLAGRVKVHNLRPLSSKVDLKADGVAMLVVFLPCLIDAVLSATLAEELGLGVIMKEDVNVAFDLLCC
jgi:hypothetical protein